MLIFIENKERKSFSLIGLIIQKKKKKKKK